MQNEDTENVTWKEFPVTQRKELDSDKIGSHHHSQLYSNEFSTFWFHSGYFHLF